MANPKLIRPETTTITAELDEAQTLSLAHSGSANLAVLAGPERGRVFPINGTAVIGRDLSATVCIPSRSVSRRHAMIAADDEGRFVIADLGSRNGTVVNGVQVQQKILELGDRIQLGPECALIFTPRDDLGDQMREAQRLESLGMLAGGAAHDFNNLLSVYSSSIEYIVAHLGEQARLDGNVQEAISDARTALARGAELTSQLKRFTRTGTSTFDPFNLSDVVIEVQRLVQRTFASLIRIQADIEPGVRIEGDPSQLHQVLMNLCVNARDAMPEGGTLRLSLAVNGGEVELQVGDTGEGIEPSVLSRVFEPFFTTKVGAGSGLGLAIAQGIVTRMKGTISATSIVGSGTTFTVRLPRYRAI